MVLQGLQLMQALRLTRIEMPEPITVAEHRLNSGG
jgi:hypothetical protein